MSLTFIDAGKSEKGWSYYGPASHCMRLFSYGYRLGVDLIPGIGLVRGSMGHTMLAHHYAKMGAKQKEGVYVGTAKGVIHVTDPATIMDPFDSLEEWCYRHSKEVDGIGANHDPEDVKQRMRDTFTNYVAREFRPPAKVIGVEVPMKGQLGQRGDQWGLWLMNEGMGELAQELGEVKPTLLDMPGHDEHGLPIMISRRADAIFADRSGRVDVVDHKCLPGHAMVETAAGPISVQRLVDSGMPGYLVNAYENNSVSLDWAEAPVDAGTQDVYNLKLSNGIEGDFGHRHPMLTERGWVEAKDIKVDDRIAVALSTKRASDLDIQDELLAVIGLLVCDGALKSKDLRFMKRRKPTLRYYQSCLLQLGLRHCEENVRPSGEDWFKQRQGYGRAAPFVQVSYNSPLHAMLDTWGVSREVAVGKCLPDEIVDRVDVQQAAVLVGALWEGGGSVSIVSNCPRICFSTRSYKLGQQVQKLLLRLGITATLKTSFPSYKGEKFKYHQVTVVGPGRNRFLHLVESGYIWAPATKAGGELTRRGNLTPSVKELMELNPGPGRQIVNNNVWWVKVDSVNFVGQLQCWDITVPKLHTFVANGMVTHNCHAHVSVKRARLEYWMGGGWAPFRILARQIWGKKYSGRIMLNLIQTTPPWTVQTTPVPLTPHRDNQFAEQLFRLAHRIAWADVNLDPWSWDMAQNSNACYGPYGLCRAAELCARGPIALRDFNQ